MLVFVRIFLLFEAACDITAGRAHGCPTPDQKPPSPVPHLVLQHLAIDNHRLSINNNTHEPRPLRLTRVTPRMDSTPLNDAIARFLEERFAPVFEDQDDLTRDCDRVVSAWLSYKRLHWRTEYNYIGRCCSVLPRSDQRSSLDRYPGKVKLTSGAPSPGARSLYLTLTPF